MMIDFINEYIISKQLWAMPTTVNSHKYSLRMFEAFVKKPLNEVTRSDIEAYFGYKMNTQKKPVARSTCATFQNQIRAFYKWMEEHEPEPYVLKNPCKGLHRIKFDKKDPVFMEMDEIYKLLDVADAEMPREGKMIRFLIATGVRISELVGIRKRDIAWNLSPATITVRGKGGKPRQVRIPDWYKEDLLEYCKGFKDEQKLFDYHTSTVQSDFRKLVKMAELNKHVTPHKCRHTFATHMLRNGADIVAIQKFLGHSSLNTTQIYTHLVDAQQDETYNKANPFSHGRV
jgi:site-specific recombinase XerD